MISVRVHRVAYVGLLGVQRRQCVEVASGDAVHEACRKTSSGVIRGFLTGIKRSDDSEYMEW